MSFLHNADKGTNRIATYILTIALVMIGYAVLGQIPLLVDLLIRSRGNEAFFDEDMNSLIQIMGENTFLVYILLPFVFSLAAVIIGVVFLHKRPMLSVFTGRERFDWKRFFLSFTVWGFVLLLTLIIMVMTGSPLEWNFNPTTFFPLLIISFILIPLQTTCEEVLFRGYLFQGFGRIYKKGFIAVVSTGVLFGLLHASNPEVEVLGNGVLVYYIGTGIFLGLLTLFDDGLELSMGYHAINNIFAALVLTNDWQAFQTDALYIDHSAPTFGWDSLLTIIVVQPLLLLLFSRIYKWKNWKEKLFGQV